jgi:DNA-directed RNA polymerase subunit RPC12/RpoP
MVAKFSELSTRANMLLEGKMRMDHSQNIEILKKNGWTMDPRFGWWFHPSKPQVKHSLGAALIFEMRKSKPKKNRPAQVCTVCGQEYIPSKAKQFRCHDCSSMHLVVGSGPGTAGRLNYESLGVSVETLSRKIESQP